MNVALLAAPWLIAGEMPPRAVPGFFTLLMAASLFYAADVQTVWKTPQNLLPTGNRDATRGASNYSAWTAMLILAAMLIAQTEHLLVTREVTLPLWLWGVQTLGALLMLCGALLRAVAIASLGERFVSELRASGETHFESRGVYGVVRHPSETAILLFVLGAVLTLLSVAGLILFVLLLTPLIVWRVRREDTFLRRVYSERYAEYAAKVAALAPGVY